MTSTIGSSSLGTVSILNAASLSLRFLIDIDRKWRNPLELFENHIINKLVCDANAEVYGSISGDYLVLRDNIPTEIKFPTKDSFKTSSPFPNLVQGLNNQFQRQATIEIFKKHAELYIYLQ